jgi:hypothetical protein
MTPQVPEIVGCDVELADGGGYMLTHRASGDTAIASTAEQAELEGIALRVTQPQYVPIRFRTDPEGQR